MNQIIGRENKLVIPPKWVPPVLPKAIPYGDMPGDIIQINEGCINRANVIFPILLEDMPRLMSINPFHRVVITVCGGSGVGKSEIASVLGYYFYELGLKSYILSGDNYPHRVPSQNDAERRRIFRSSGTRGLVANGIYNEEYANKLRELQQDDKDALSSLCDVFPWLTVYQKEGKKGLKSYLGTDREIDFSQISDIVTQFKNGAKSIFLKRMSRNEIDLSYKNVDFSDIQVLLIEWTHGNSDFYPGVDIAVLLNSTPQETLEHRRNRGRDKGTDSPFTNVVLELEQELLHSQAHKAKIIISKAGNILSWDDYCVYMTRQGV